MDNPMPLIDRLVVATNEKAVMAGFTPIDGGFALIPADPPHVRLLLMFDPDNTGKVELDAGLLAELAKADIEARQSAADERRQRTLDDLTERLQKGDDIL